VIPDLDYALAAILTEPNLLELNGTERVRRLALPRSEPTPSQAVRANAGEPCQNGLLEDMLDTDRAFSIFWDLTGGRLVGIIVRDNNADDSAVRTVVLLGVHGILRKCIFGQKHCD